MNQNLELEIAGQLYEQLFTTHAKTDGRLMEFESFIVRHYGHDGTTLIRTIAERHSAGPVVFVETPKQGRQLRPFVHPDAKKATAQSNPVLTNTTRKGAAVQPDAPVVQPDAPVVQPDAPVVQTDVAPGGENPPLTSNELPVVAVDGGHEQTATTNNVGPITISPDVEKTATMTGEFTINIDDAKTMKAAAFGKKYGIGPLRKFLEERGVKYDGNPSVTQLAALAIQTINGTK